MQLFVNNPWNAYVKGDTKAISPAAKRGALLFYQVERKTPHLQGGDVSECRLYSTLPFNELNYSA